MMMRVVVVVGSLLIATGCGSKKADGPATPPGFKHVKYDGSKEANPKKQLVFELDLPEVHVACPADYDYLCFQSSMAVNYDWAVFLEEVTPFYNDEQPVLTFDDAKRWATNRWKEVRALVKDGGSAEGDKRYLVEMNGAWVMFVKRGDKYVAATCTGDEKITKTICESFR